MIERYQANVVWIGRRPYDAAIEEKINSLARLGNAPLYISADATSLDALDAITSNNPEDVSRHSWSRTLGCGFAGSEHRPHGRIGVQSRLIRQSRYKREHG